MQQALPKYLLDPRLSTSSHSSTSAAVLNGILPSHRLSQTFYPLPPISTNVSPNQARHLRKGSRQIKRSQQIKRIVLIVGLILLLAFLLVSTIELATRIVKQQRFSSTKIQILNLTNSTTTTTNETKSKANRQPIRAFFASVWLFNGLLFVNCLTVRSCVLQRRSPRGRTKTAYLREFGGIFDDGKSSSNNTFIDYIMKTCSLCFLWYLCCYFLLRSMVILSSAEIIIIYSITVTARQVLGWIVLHEQFIGNKIIAHILALSGLLFLAHNDGFRFNTFLFGLCMATCSAALKTIFDVLVHGFVKDLTNSKLTVLMINVCLCGTCLLWPLILLLHVTQSEPLEYDYFHWPLAIGALVSALVYNVLTITLPFEFTSVASVASFLLVIPSITLIDRYWLNVNYSPLFISAILCSFGGILLSLVPKQWFQAGEGAKMKQALGLLNKDSHLTGGAGPTGAGGGTSSTFDEIRAQRRIRNAYLYNEVKS